MKNKGIIIVLAVLLIVSLFFNAVLLYRLYRETRGESFNPEYALQIEDMAPDFSVELLTGETFTLSEHRGTVVVLDFWATWCGPCVAKMPTVQTLSEQFGDSVKFVGINVGESRGRVQEFINERGFTFPIGVDEDNYIHRNLYPSPGVPYMVIINGDGVITDTFLGGGEGLIHRYEAAILEALG
ncbi:MAG: TlpA family protein disulfide reductase [Defluviitaleaceae bacterium]|nr:TlpA family protein disulfide reductase [Defluviitaleaceae bacterium]